ncbi:8-amino-7-oxononanoate synthase/2-amino-3-ketobutyrate coenzyme A ligase,8-amino-7-oxononanoate synthase,7-keto-8-aminopelargonate synthetase and related enzymes,8-amino-7-oxononanoate synthase,Aminotransferase class I and II [Chlamydia serpentis]|uniref:Aminotransferase class I/classII large domain-containing protein n=1 Tax=Chlamydia serpentis TaxID=1967782 RepID=A0A2R8FC88_9CHLA|nr:aminotransferase class I/II-fold pyridoxal phosphate-dependent enzyme [Chlamydia serpentis]SPN74033.1 8-amino-7-oxononanoate synthase/2-amino-3-ketobutyrate coenzyme A ligase,8-amino-7-oxononanoate synthase,7-keto-8-aminopelargonate synthetase and related enzymes,8-amino-7-oxononanoate synthase,Aminotransferase class I and II [Chlamydia serpentis]
MTTSGVVDFVTNDFLGFARSPTICCEVNKRFYVHCHKFPNEKLGTCGSRLMIGSSRVIDDLEVKIADYHGAPNAFLVNSGYMANLGLCYHLSRSNDVLLWDEEVHMSVVHSVSVIAGQHHAFHHNDLEHLESLLQRYRTGSTGRIFIFVSSVYSFKGTLAPLEEIITLSKKYHAHLVVDEAHAMGIFGEQGKGFCHALGYENFYAVLITFGKAMGTMGASLLTSSEVKYDLMCNSPPLRYSTCLSPYALISIDTAYDFLASEGEKAREQLFKLKEHFSRYFSSHAPGCVQPIFLRQTCLEEVISVLEKANIRVGLVAFAKYPFLRVNLHAYNTVDEVSQLAQIMKQYLEKSSRRVHINHEFHLWRELCQH